MGGFGSAREQGRLCETLDPQTQRILLMRAAEEAGGAVKDVGPLTAAWGRGDVAALEKMINEDIDSVPAARKAILTDRNRPWSAWVKRRMEQTGTVLMAVGAGHLVGSEDVRWLYERARRLVT